MTDLAQGDCISIMDLIPSESIDMILCDLPYGTTAHKWDSVIPFEELWGQYKRLIKPRGAIVLFGAEPFSSRLRISALKLFKYDWIWVKSRAFGFLNAKLKPMNKHETISVFSKGTTANKAPNNMLYFPQNLKPLNKKVKGTGKGSLYSRQSNKPFIFQEFTNYPTSVLEYPNEQAKFHPTQKPIELLKYLIKSYTRPDEVVLDNTMGSGSTGVAAIMTGRKFIGIEQDARFFSIAQKRLAEACKSF